MKKFYLFVLSLFVCSSVIPQEAEKTYFENNPKLGGDVVLKSSSYKVVGEDIYKTFEIESLQDGMYYVDAWIAVPVIDGRYPEFKVAVNGIISESTFKPQDANWQAISLTNAKKSAATVKLKKGINSVSVIGKGPEIPNVEFLKFSLNPLNAGISDKNYREFVERIKSNSLIDVKYGDTLQVVTRSSNSIATRNSSINSIGGFNPVTTRGTSGEIYDYAINIPVYYTTWKELSYSSGQTATITTSQSGNYEHVIEFFEKNNPASYSWVSYSSGNGSLTVSIPVTGTYHLRIRAYRQYTSGLVNLTVNGTTYPNCVVAGSGMAMTFSYSTPSNFFTCKIKNSGDTRLYLEDYSSLPGKIRAHNDDGGTKSDGYSWGLASFVTTSVANINSGLISAYSSNSPAFECDLYLGLAPTNNSLITAFTSLKQDNSFISGPVTGVYNCHSWAGGISNSWKNLSNVSDADNFYNPRGYTRSGANASNAAIAVWVNTTTGAITHSSVTKNSTYPLPHGFEWESKCGSMERVMHTRDAVGAGPSGYGYIAYYYRPTNGTVNYSLCVDENDNDNNISTRSLTAQKELFNPSDLSNESYFSQSDLNQITILKDRIPTNIAVDFYDKYLTWAKTWSRPEIAFHSHSRKYAESEEYKNLLNYSLKYGKSILPLIFEKLHQPSDFFVVNLLEDMTFPENQHLYDDIVSYVDSKAKTDGIPTPSSNSIWIDYSKKLLEKDYDNILKSIQNIPVFEDEVIDMNTFATTNGRDILLNIYSDEVAKAHVQIYNVFGKLEYESNYNIPKGGQTAVIDVSNLQKGVYVIQITVGSKTVSQKISI